MKITALLMCVQLFSAGVMAQDTDWESVAAVHSHYVGCLDGVAWLKHEEGASLDASLQFAERHCERQFEVVEGSIQRLFETRLGRENYVAHRAEVDQKIAELVNGAQSKARRDARDLVQQREENDAVLKVVQSATDGAIKAAAEATTPAASD